MEQAQSQESPASAQQPAPSQAEPQSGDTQDSAQSQEDPQFARRFAALTRRDREIQRKAQAIAEKERSIAEKEAKYAEWEKQEALKENDPLGYLQARGLTYQELTDRILADNSISDEEKLERLVDAKLEASKKQQEEERNKEREAEQAAKEERLITEYKNRIGETVRSEVERYELLSIEGQNGLDLVFDVAAGHYDETGEILDPSVAAEHVEKYLEKRYKEVFNSKKLSKLRGLDSEETQQEFSEQETHAPKTLTNRSMQSSGYSEGQSSAGYIMDDEQSKRAAAETLRKALARQG